MKSQRKRQRWVEKYYRRLRTVFLNPQSILCGLISGLLFIPTTIFDMIWGVRYLQEAHGSRLWFCGDAFSDSSYRMDHWLSSTWFHF